MAIHSALVVPEELELHRRARLARLAVGLTPEAVARELGMSKRSYERAEAGDRRLSRAELVLLAELTGQAVSFFGVTSGGGKTSLPSPLPGVKLAGGEVG